MKPRTRSTAPSRRSEKGRVAALRKGARDGDLAIRARLATALHVRRMRLASGAEDPEDFNESEDAEAGGLVEAEDATDATAIKEMVSGYLKALAKG